MVEGDRQDTGAYTLSVMAGGGPWRWGWNRIWQFALSLYGHPGIWNTLYVLMNSGRQPFLYL